MRKIILGLTLMSLWQAAPAAENYQKEIKKEICQNVNKAHLNPGDYCYKPYNGDKERENINKYIKQWKLYKWGWRNRYQTP